MAFDYYTRSSEQSPPAAVNDPVSVGAARIEDAVPDVQQANVEFEDDDAMHPKVHKPATSIWPDIPFPNLATPEVFSIATTNTIICSSTVSGQAEITGFRPDCFTLNTTLTTGINSAAMFCRSKALVSFRANQPVTNVGVFLIAWRPCGAPPPSSAVEASQREHVLMDVGASETVDFAVPWYSPYAVVPISEHQSGLGFFDVFCIVPPMDLEGNNIVLDLVVTSSLIDTQVFGLSGAPSTSRVYGRAVNVREEFKYSSAVHIGEGITNAVAEAEVVPGTVSSRANGHMVVNKERAVHCMDTPVTGIVGAPPAFADLEPVDVDPTIHSASVQVEERHDTLEWVKRRKSIITVSEIDVTQVPLPVLRLDGDPTVYAGTVPWWLSNIYNDWRGSVELLLNFYASGLAMSSARIVIALVRVGTTDPTDVCYKKVVDLTKSQRVKLSIPYVGSHLWCSAGSFPFDILIYPETFAVPARPGDVPKVNLVAYMGFGPDVEFRTFRNALLSLTQDNHYKGSRIPISDASIWGFPGAAVAQGEPQLETDFEPIIGTASDYSYGDGLSHGSTSWRSLCRLPVLVGHKIDTADRIAPRIPRSSLDTASLPLCFQSRLVDLFAFNKGSTVYTISRMPFSMDGTDVRFRVTTTQGDHFRVNYDVIGLAQHDRTVSTSEPVAIRVPYVGRYAYVPNHAKVPNDYTVELGLSYGSNEVYWSFGEDFALSFFIGVPNLAEGGNYYIPATTADPFLAENPVP